MGGAGGLPGAGAAHDAAFDIGAQWVTAPSDARGAPAATAGSVRDGHPRLRKEGMHTEENRLVPATLVPSPSPLCPLCKRHSLYSAPGGFILSLRACLGSKQFSLFHPLLV